MRLRIRCIGDRPAGSDHAAERAAIGTGARDPFIALPEFAGALRKPEAAGVRVRSDPFRREAHVMSPPDIPAIDAVLRAFAEDLPLFAGGAA